MGEAWSTPTARTIYPDDVTFQSTQASVPRPESMKSLVVAMLCLTSGACFLYHGKSAAPSLIPKVEGTPKVAFALRVLDVVAGTGAPMVARKCAYAHYTGWLTDGTKFDSSRDSTTNGKPKPPISFPQGARRVIAGWDAGFEGMKIGGRRRLFIPYQLGYGEPGRPPTIPSKADLVFDVELMAVSDTLPRTDAVPRGQASPPQCPAWAALSAVR
jgi:peptidylprolyl isomerase